MKLDGTTRMNPVLKKLHLDEREFVTSHEIRKYCRQFGTNPKNTIRNLSSRGHLVRIFRGVFYVRSFEEVKMGRLRYSHMELVSKGLEILGIDNWYFCLFTALKLNNMTHEFFSVEHVASDVLFRNRPMDIVGIRFKFYRLKRELLLFGIETKGALRYSDPEKTLLDLVYIWRYNSVPDNKIKMDISDYLEGLSNDKVRTYLRHYPKSVGRTLEGLI